MAIAVLSVNSLEVVAEIRCGIFAQRMAALLKNVPTSFYSILEEPPTAFLLVRDNNPTVLIGSVPTSFYCILEEPPTAFLLYQNVSKARYLSCDHPAMTRISARFSCDQSAPGFYRIALRTGCTDKEQFCGLLVAFALKWLRFVHPSKFLLGPVAG
uniref:Uncharacterized protein n=1 Tax=Pristionchus pacificus TaxID=54126 RepID=A0A2A6BI59_PRIPA|eukprot:PDM65516.1 hypothetical protein PRIPAC_52458 [Pristionchus pacificus]